MGITLKNNKPVTKNMTIKGDDGVGIKTITSGTPTITEEKTTTPITVTLTDETTQNFNVEAQNGSGGGTGSKNLYHKYVTLTLASGVSNAINTIIIEYYSQNSSVINSITAFKADINNSFLIENSKPFKTNSVTYTQLENSNVICHSFEFSVTKLLNQFARTVSFYETSLTEGNIKLHTIRQNININVNNISSVSSSVNQLK